MHLHILPSHTLISVIKNPLQRHRLRLVRDYNFEFRVICQWNKFSSPRLALIPLWKLPQTFLWGSSPSNLYGQCSSCGSSGQQKQSVDIERQTPLKYRQENATTGVTLTPRGNVFILVEIWLLLQLPSFSHEIRGSQKLHLWGAYQHISQVTKPEALCC